MAQIVNPTQLKVRQLQCKIILQSGTFEKGNNTLILNNSTINAQVNKTMSNNFSISADITIDGLSYSEIAALSTLGYVPLVYEFNRIELYAQYEGQSQSLCFSGYIVKAFCDFSDPNRPMHFQCQTVYQEAINTTNPINSQGNIDIKQLFSNIASKMGLSLETNGSFGTIKNAIFSGSNIDQLKQLSKQTNNNCVVDNGRLKVANKGLSLSNVVLNINSGSGLIGYPKIDDKGITLKIRYEPSLQLGQYIKLETIVPIPKSNGMWYVYDMQSSLNNRHENWYTDLKCSFNNLI